MANAGFNKPPSGKPNSLNRTTGEQLGNLSVGGQGDFGQEEEMPEELQDDQMGDPMDELMSLVGRINEIAATSLPMIAPIADHFSMNLINALQEGEPGQAPPGMPPQGMPQGQMPPGMPPQV